MAERPGERVSDRAHRCAAHLSAQAFRHRSHRDDQRRDTGRGDEKRRMQTAARRVAIHPQIGRYGEMRQNETGARRKREKHTERL